MPTTPYMAGAVGTYCWRAADIMGTSWWWILAASTVDSTLVIRSEHLDATDTMGISSSRVANIVGTSSNWRVVITVGVVGAAPATFALASSGMSPI
jgi:hypothetical protein